MMSSWEFPSKWNQIKKRENKIYAIRLYYSLELSNEFCVNITVYGWFFKPNPNTLNSVIYSS